MAQINYRSEKWTFLYKKVMIKFIANFYELFHM